MSWLQFLLATGGFLGLLVAAIVDWRSRIIPNELVIWVFIMGGLLRLNVAPSQIYSSLAIAVAVFAPLAVLAFYGAIGGGDAKMIAASTLLVAPGQTLALLAAIAIAGGALSLLFLARERLDRAAAARRVGLPYGLAIFAGHAFILLWST